MTVTRTSKKIVSILLVFFMLAGILPFAPAVDTKVSAAGSRDTVVSYMRSMATIKWKPQKNITYYAQDGRKYYAGTTYTGIPYTQNNRQNLATFKSKLSGSTYVGATSAGSYVGNDCSSAVMYSWKQITNGISFSYTGNMFPGSGTGVKKVGSYNANSTTSTKKITTSNGKNTMFAAYAQLKPGDAVVARVSGVVNHTRIVSSVGSSYVTCIEQCGLSSSRGATTWNVDKKYTFSQLYSTYYIPITCTALQNASGGSATGPSKLSISSYNVPTSLAVGKSFSIYGTISSNYNISSVTVGIYNANGGTVSAKTVKPNSTYFSIATVDKYIKFGAAKAGTNYYKVVATDAKKTATLVNKAYTVGSSGSSSAASTLSISDYNFPSSIVEGKSFSIKGTVKSNYKITSLTVGIYNANGGSISTKTVKPNATSYAIKNVDAYIKFGAAKAGTNYYKVVATDAKQTKTLLNKAFTVTGKGGSTAASTLTLTGYNYPTSLALGKSFSIKGTISSNYSISSVTVGIYNANGGAVSAKTVNPNAKSYSLTKIDAYIKFGAAKAGTNYYKISATDAKKTAVLLNKAYTVSGGTAAASTLSISGYNVPSTLALGKSFSIKGTVKSNYKITSLTVGIYNANGNAVSTKTVAPNATSYSIANVDKYIIFGKAPAGTNYYKIIATDTKTTKTLVNQKYTVTGGTSSAASTLSLSGYNVPSSLAVGKSFSIKGKVTSNYKISSVTVGIYNANGGAVSTKTVNPASTSFNIATVDAYIKFGAAKAGTNYYKIVATDAKQTKTLLNHAYSVTGGSSNNSASTLKISGHNTPGTLSVGASFSIYGTVSSNYNISSLTVGIYNSNGGAVSAKTVSPNAKSYSIKNIDAYIKFGAAKAGTNYYKVVATDAKQTKTLLNHAYTVKSGGSSPSGGSGADKIVEVAKSQVGVSGRPNKYTRWYGTIDGSYSYAWCATFVSWCANQAGVSSYITKTASCYWMADGFSKRGTLKSSSYNPVKGDILFFDNSSTSGAYNHVGIVVSYNSSTGAITTVEGNTSSASQANGNTVAIKTRYKNTSGFKVSAFAHPGY